MSVPGQVLIGGHPFLPKPVRLEEVQKKPQVRERSRTCAKRLVRVQALRLNRREPPDVRGLLALRAGRDVKLYRFTLAQGLETIPLYRGVMNEDILPILRGNESVPLLIAEPLHCSF